MALIQIARNLDIRFKLINTLHHLINACPKNSYSNPNLLIHLMTLCDPYQLQIQPQWYKIRMDSKLSGKRQKFTEQIRRTQIHTIITDCRSKMIAWSQEVDQDYDLLDSILQTQPNDFCKIKTIFRGIIENKLSVGDEQGQLAEMQTHKLILLCVEGGANILKVQLNELQSIQINREALVKILRILGKQICKKVGIMNINFKQTLKMISNQLLIAKIHIISKQLTEMIEIIQCCDCFIAELVRTKEEKIDQQILKELTSCLIELSCFKPRNYSTHHQLQIISQVNLKMHTIKQLFNTSITAHLYQLINQKITTGTNLSIIINFLYIFGNIFVSLSSNPLQNTQQYKELHDLCFALFKSATAQIFPTMPSEHQITQQIVQSKDFSELASVMVWFIRNEVLIIEGIYKTVEQSSEGNSQRQMNEQWLTLIMNILQHFSKEYGYTYKLSLGDTITLIDLISLLKLLKYDFNLPLPALCLSVSYLRTFLRRTKGPQLISKKLVDQIYELSAELLHYNQESIDQVTHNNQHYLQLYSKLYEQAVLTIKGQDLRPQCFKLCSAILSVHCTSKKIKQPFYQQVCSNFQLLMLKMKAVVDYQQTKQRFNFIYEVVKQFQSRRCTDMQNELVSYESLSAIVLLCSRIWENKKNNDEDIIDTLQLLRLLADNQDCAVLLKQVVQGECYCEILEGLQAESNEEINRLAYQICEVLEIE